MVERILTTHVGSLPRPAKLLEESQKRTLGEKFDEAAFEQVLKNSVIDVVRLQKEAGVDLINDGELGHTMGWAYDYGSWWSYVVKRLSGVEVSSTGLWATTLSAHTKTSAGAKRFRRRQLARIAATWRSSMKPIWILTPGADCPSSS